MLRVLQTRPTWLGRFVECLVFHRPRCGSASRTSQLVQARRPREAYTWPMNITRDDGLLAWQWSIYSYGHQERRNLAVHALTAPLFILGTCALPLAALLRVPWLAGCGLGVMLATLVLQGRTHKREKTPPEPFRGPLDVLARFFAEQWVTFPRYVLSGEFARAWSKRL